MPFGRHKGRPLEDIPTDYLEWLQANCDLRPRLARAVERELLERRTGGGSSGGWFDGFQAGYARGRAEAKAGAPVVVVEGLLRQVHRKLALDFHPDKKGGSSDGMKAINVFADEFRERLKKQA